MAKTGRLELRVEPGLLARVDARCEVLGQTRTKFIERALESALDSRSAAVPQWVANEMAAAVADAPVEAVAPRPVPGVTTAGALVRARRVDPAKLAAQERLNKAKK